MNEDIPEPHPDLTPEQEEKVAKLSEKDIEEIDAALLSHAKKQWQKQAMIIGKTMMELPERTPGIPDIFYAQRIKKLVEKGYLVAQGNLDYMRFSEVRLPPEELKNET